MPNQELIDLIIKPENLRCAWDIADAIDDVNNYLRCKFWRAIAESLKEGLACMAQPNGWKIDGLSEITSDTNKSNAGVYLTAVGTTPTSGGLRLGAWQDWKGRSLRLFHGVGFTTEQPDPQPLGDKLGNLRDALPDEWKSEGMDGWWVGWCWTSLDTQSHDFLFSVSTDAGTLAGRATDTVIRALKDQSLWQRIVEVDSALRG